jgi:alkylation response protein AidB-like acyl-CoA dehydrogenase
VALDKAVKYANDREVFGRPIGMNQGIQFPLADSLTRLDAAELMLRKATCCAPTPALPPRTGHCKPTAAWATRRSTT